jgi:CRISPR-associated protein Cas5h
MQAIRFELSGRTGFFKKPDVNSYYYFTYGSIHKIALLGIMGSVMGLGGYNKQSESKKRQVYPEFYEKLKESKIAIIIDNNRGYITKKIQTFNNSVGYASLEQGGNLIIKEQWLQNPHWIIYVKIDEITDKFAEMIENNRAMFIPCLGKNDHFANITKVKKVELGEVKDVNKVDSLFITNNFKIGDSTFNDKELSWKYQEYLPISLDRELNQYEFGDFTATNKIVTGKGKDNVNLYRDKELNKIIYLF